MTIKIKLFFRTGTSFFLLCGLFACAGNINETNLNNCRAIHRQYPTAPPRNNEGSLWEEKSYLNRLYVDHKAMEVGDLVTIKVVEASSASKKAGTKTGRKSSITASIDKFFNLEKRYPAAHPFLNPFSGIQGNMENDFDGSGVTTRSGSLKTTISAKVIEVLPNRNLVIEGRREIVVNNEEQFIILSGIIRSEDISPQNMIYSTKIADARITYNGKGIIASKQQAGWMTQVFDRVWPF